MATAVTLIAKFNKYFMLNHEIFIRNFYIYLYILYFTLCYITDYSFESLLNIISFSVKKKLYISQSPNDYFLFSLFQQFILLYFSYYYISVGTETFLSTLERVKMVNFLLYRLLT